MLHHLDPLPYAIPFFVIAILFEIYWTQKFKRHQYKFKDAAACITLSNISYIAGLFGTGIKMFCYYYIYQYFRMSEMTSLSISMQINCFLSLIILQDFIYYWFHRLSHRVNFFWASHIVHHSSEEYNLAVALRQSTFQQYLSWPLYLPLALIGFPPEWLVSVISINLIYQFWFHTREIDRMPEWFETIFNTPSHHRVHHGTNPQYLDKNYAGIFILWDRWFGSFEPEAETVRYGITVPVNSYNPIWINLHYLWYLCQMSRAAPSLTKALKIWLAPPDWKPDWNISAADISQKSESTGAAT